MSERQVLKGLIYSLEKHVRWCDETDRSLEARAAAQKHLDAARERLRQLNKRSKRGNV